MRCTDSLHSLTYLELEGAYADPPAAGHLAIVFVDPRLWTHPLIGSVGARLRRFKSELRSQGLHTRSCAPT